MGEPIVRCFFLPLSLAGAVAWGVVVPGHALAQRDTSPYLTTGMVAGAAMGGIGAILNRKAGESWPRNVVRGAVTGAAGGWLQYQGKRQATRVTTRDRLEYA